MPLPPPVSVEPFDEFLELSLASFFQQRLSQSVKDSYRGREMAKMPEDMRTYQHIIEMSQPDVIVELGTAAGGSAMWFADQLLCLTPQTVGGINVITVDVKAPKRPLEDPVIGFIYGDLSDPAIVAQVYQAVGGRRAMVVEDSAHSYAVTLKALELYSALVAQGCYFVVEDGAIDEPAVVPNDWRDRGVQKAVTKFCEDHPYPFTREWLAPYGITSNHGGWLKRNG